MFSKTFMAAAMLAAAAAGDSELFLIDQALQEYEAELADKKEHKTPAEAGELISQTSKLGKMSNERKLGGCSIFSSKTGQGFSWAAVDKKMKAATGTPGNLDFNIGSGKNKEISRFQSSICSIDAFNIIAKNKASSEKKRIITSDACKNHDKAFGVLGSLVQGNETYTKQSVNSDFECAYTFEEPEVAATNYNEEEKAYKGIYTKYTSDQKTCKEGAAGEKTHFVISYNMTCDEKKEWDGVWTQKGKNTNCVKTFVASGHEGCNTINLAPFYKYMMVLGAVEFLIGLVICFYGIKVYDKLIFLFAFLGTAAVVFGISFTFYTTSATPLIIGGILAVICGLGVAYVFRAFIMEHGVAILGLVCGGILGLMLSAPIANTIAKFAIMAALGGVGAFIGYKYNEFIKVLGMAIVGSGMIVHGLGQYIGKFPPLSLPNADAAKDLITPAFIGYAVAFIILAFAGYFVQKSVHTSNKGGKNAFDEE